jgi:hypothetical protein
VWWTFARRSPGFWTGLLLLVCGAGFLAAGWTPLRQEQQYRTQGELTDGVVTTKAIERATRSGSGGPRTQTHYNVSYRFTARDTHTYEGSQDVVAASWDRLRELQPVRVQYVRSAPSINRLAGENAGAFQYVFPGLGLVIALAGTALLGRTARRAQAKARIWAHGTAADAIVASVEETNVKVNRRRMWVVRYQYRDDSGYAHDGRSEYMSPDRAHVWKRGDSIRVRFDPRKPGMSVWPE